jgi:hypothetical protein
MPNIFGANNTVAPTTATMDTSKPFDSDPSSHHPQIDQTTNNIIIMDNQNQQRTTHTDPHDPPLKAHLQQHQQSSQPLHQGTTQQPLKTGDNDERNVSGATPSHCNDEKTPVNDVTDLKAHYNNGGRPRVLSDVMPSNASTRTAAGPTTNNNNNNQDNHDGAISNVPVENSDDPSSSSPSSSSSSSSSNGPAAVTTEEFDDDGVQSIHENDPSSILPPLQTRQRQTSQGHDHLEPLTAVPPEDDQTEAAARQLPLIETQQQQQQHESSGEGRYPYQHQEPTHISGDPSLENPTEPAEQTTTTTTDTPERSSEAPVVMPTQQEERPSVHFQLVPYHEDPAYINKSLTLVERTLEESKVIRLGRQVLRDGQPVPPPNAKPGKPSDLDVWFTSKVVSRHHAELWVKDGTVSVGVATKSPLPLPPPLSLFFLFFFL